MTAEVRRISKNCTQVKVLIEIITQGKVIIFIDTGIRVKIYIERTRNSIFFPLKKNVHVPKIFVNASIPYFIVHH